MYVDYIFKVILVLDIKILGIFLFSYQRSIIQKSDSQILRNAPINTKKSLDKTEEIKKSKQRPSVRLY